MKGFTLIEVLVVLGIFVILAAVAMPVYGNWQGAVQMDTSLEEIRSALRRAQAKSLSGENDAAHGVYFSVDPEGHGSFIIYQGDAYAARSEEYDAAAVWPDSLALSLDIGADEINFSQSEGLPSAVGSISLVGSDTGEIGSLTINNWGIIE